MIFQVFVTIVALVLIFIFSINKFSRQIELVAGNKFRTLISQLTKNSLMGMMVGTVVTSLVQSSTATTVMTVGLVNAGLLTFYKSVGVILGANIGTTITSQLIALNVIAIAPFVIIAGFLLLKVGGRHHVYGKSVFYFGLVFFCISLITQVAQPLMMNESILALLSKMTSVPLAILAGFLVTTLFQSSSVTTGVVLALAVSGLIDLQQGIGLILGANIGTTSTALIVSIPMTLEARKTALAHAMFNLVGVLLIFPFITPFTNFIASFGGTAAQQIANAHFLFNVIIAAVFLCGIKQFTRVVEWLATFKIFHTGTKVWGPNI